ncbi:hypothetical protein [Staphylococcus hominis]|uniref:hypothetical protein n=1 Tax=Staphylococcus hominis TaxID=1290 RepID=UPI003709B062
MYMILLLSLIFPIKPSIFQTILFNFQLLLSLLIYIQPFTFIHFFRNPKPLPHPLSILLILLPTLISPFTHILSLLPLLHLRINLKPIIKK